MGLVEKVPVSEMKTRLAVKTKLYRFINNFFVDTLKGLNEKPQFIQSFNNNTDSRMLLAGARIRIETLYTITNIIETILYHTHIYARACEDLETTCIAEKYWQQLREK